MDIEEIKQKTKEELMVILETSRKKLRDLRFDLIAGKVKNIKSVHGTRKDIARILTVLKEKNI